MGKRPKPTAAPAEPEPERAVLKEKRRRRRRKGVMPRRSRMEVNRVIREQRSSTLVFPVARVRHLLRTVRDAELAGPYRGLWQQKLGGAAVDFKRGVVAVVHALVERRVQKVLRCLKCLQQASGRITATPGQLSVAVKMAEMAH